MLGDSDEQLVKREQNNFARSLCAIIIFTGERGGESKILSLCPSDFINDVNHQVGDD